MACALKIIQESFFCLFFSFSFAFFFFLFFFSVLCGELYVLVMAGMGESSCGSQAARRVADCCLDEVKGRVRLSSRQI